LFLVEVMDLSDVLNDPDFVPHSRLQGEAEADDNDDDDDDEDFENFDDDYDYRQDEKDKLRYSKVRMKVPPFRIVVSSATNTAVDRVLEGLLAVGYTDFLRVGSLQKMSRKVLRNTLHEEEKDAAYELKKQLKSSDLTKEEEKCIVEELEEIASGRAKKRKHRLQLSPLVGTTCSASLFKLFKDNTFEVLMLDECSQMIEPLSLLPISSFRPQKLICVGDPMQLAPPLPSASSSSQDLSLALFSRLAQYYNTIMLTTQYRCHPDIAGLCSRLFYRNSLLSGVTADARPPLVDGIAPLLFIDTSGMGTELKDRFGSYSNPLMTNICLQLLGSHLAPLLPHRVAFITLFRAQARELHEAFLKRPALAAQVATVDSFQGAEKDVVVLVVTRGGAFAGDLRRLNVALSRARHHCIIIGHCRALRESSKEWKTIIAACQVKNADEMLMQ
jgi:superfamily I DNA and/or RNA helicase